MRPRQHAPRTTGSGGPWALLGSGRLIKPLRSGESFCGPPPLMRPVTTTRLIRELRLELSAMFFIAGIVLTIFPIGHYFVKAPNLPPILQDIDLRLGEWNVWLIVL